MKDLEKVLSEQISDLKVSEISPCETEMYSIYLDRMEKDNSKWLELITNAIKDSKTFGFLICQSHRTLRYIIK